MSGSANRWVLRLSTEGADQVIRDLRAAATESAAAGRAYDALIKAQPQLATGAERAEQALRQNVDAIRGMRGELGLVSAAVDGATGSFGRFGSALTSPAAAIAALSAGAAAGVASIARLGDEYTTTMNKLRAATGSLGAAQQVYGELVALSQQTGASISESAGAFVRFSVAARAIGATNGEVLQLTRTIQQAGLISGASTQEAAAGVQQLGQALASGTLQGDELRSILENMPTLAEALARELGVSIGQLRSMGSEGQLTSDRVFQALLRASEAINKQFTELTPTMGRAFGVLGQAMVEFVGKLDQALGLSQAIARVAGAAAAAVGQVSGGMGPRSPAEQADFDVAQARERIARLEAEVASLSGEPGLYATPRRGTISRAMQEAAAQAQPREERLAELRQRIEAENSIIREGLARRNQAHTEADEIRQAEEATAAARRAAAARTTQTTAFNSTREALDREAKLRADHATRITAIEAGLANGNTDAARAARLRRLANDELADGLRSLEQAARGRIETDEEIARVSRIVEDIEKDRLSLLREGVSITQSVRTEAEKYAEQLGVLNALLNEGAITQETYNRAVAAADPAIKAARDAARQVEQDNKTTTDSIVRYAGDRFADLFGDNQKSWREMWRGFLGTARSTLARIAAEAVIRPIIAPVVSSLGLGSLSASGMGQSIGLGNLLGGGSAQAAVASNAGSVSAATQQAGQSAGLFGLGRSTGLDSAFTGGLSNTGYVTIDSALNTTLWGGGAGNIAAGVPGAAGDGGALLAHATQSPGVTVGGALGGVAGIAGGAYGMYSGIQRGGIGGYTTAAGGLLSAGMGAASLVGLGSLGPPGWIAAAVLAIAGALLPGQKASGKGQSAYVNVDDGGLSYAGLGGDRFSQGNRDQAEGAARQIAALARQVGDKLGGAQFGAQVAVGVTSSRGGGAGDLYLDVAGRKAQFANDEGGSKALAEEAGRLILRQFREAGRASGDYAGILNASGDNLQTLQANLDFYEGTYKALSKSAEAASAYSQQLTAATRPYDDAIVKARELGLAEDGLARERDKAAAKVDALREASLAQADLSLTQRGIAAGLGGGDTFALAQRVAEQQATLAAREELDQFREAMRQAGATTEEVTALVERLTTVQGAEAAQRREMADTQRREGLQAITNSVLERAGQAGFGIDRAALEESQAALQAAADLRSLTAELQRVGAGADQIAELSGVLTRSFEAEAQQRAALRAAAEGAAPAVAAVARAVDQLGINASALDLFQRALNAGLGVDARWLEESRAAIQGERDVKALRTSLVEMGATADEVAGQVTLLAQVQQAEATQRAKTAAEAARAAADAAHQKRQEAFRSAQSAYVSALDAEITQRERLTSTARANVDALRAAAEGLRDYMRGLVLDTNLSPLTMSQRLEESRAQYDRLTGQTQTGTASDRANAARQLQGAASSRLGLASSYYAPGTAAYVAEFNGVTQGLNGLADQFGMAASVDELALQAQEASLAVLREQKDIAQRVGQETLKGLAELRQTFLEVAAGAGWTVATGPQQSAPVTGASAEWPWSWADPRAMGHFGARASGESLFGGLVTAGEQLNTASVNALYQQFLGRDAEAGVAEQWMGFGGRGFDLAGALEQSAEFQVRLAQMRGYAAGGYAAPGFALVGEEGPELVRFREPGRVYTAGQTREIMGANDQALRAEIKALREMVAQLCVVTAQGSMAVVGAVDGQTEILVDATMPRTPVPA